MDFIKFIKTNDDIFSIKIFIPLGSIHEDSNKKGIYHLLEHLKMKSSINYTRKNFLNKISEFKDKNAYTTKDHTCYYINSVSKRWKDVIDIIYNMAFSLNVNKDILEKEKKIILQEMLYRNNKIIKNSNNDNIDKYIEISIYDEKNPYSNNIIGSLETINNIKLKDIKELKKLYLNDYLIIIKCNNKIYKEVLKYSNKKFKKPLYNNLKIIENTNSFNYKLIIKNLNINYYYCTFIFKTFPGNNNNNYLIDFIINSLKIYPNGELYKLLRIKHSLIYTLDELDNIVYKDNGYLYLSITTNNKENLLKSIKIIISILNKLKEKGYGKNIEKYKDIVIKYLKNNENKLFDLKCEKIFYNNDFNFNNYLLKLKNITNKIIKDISKKIFNFNTLSLGINGKFEDIDKIEKKYYNLILKEKKKYN